MPIIRTSAAAAAAAAAAVAVHNAQPTANLPMLRSKPALSVLRVIFCCCSFDTSQLSVPSCFCCIGGFAQSALTQMHSMSHTGWSGNAAAAGQLNYTYISHCSSLRFAPPSTRLIVPDLLLILTSGLQWCHHEGATGSQLCGVASAVAMSPGRGCV